MTTLSSPDCYVITKRTEKHSSQVITFTCTSTADKHSVFISAARSPGGMMEVKKQARETQYITIFFNHHTETLTLIKPSPHRDRDKVSTCMRVVYAHDVHSRASQTRTRVHTHIAHGRRTTGRSSQCVTFRMYHTNLSRTEFVV